MTTNILSDTIYFTNFSTINGDTVHSLTIDSIGNLPYGTCWISNKLSNTFAGGENGVICLHGHIFNFAFPGQFKLKILVHGLVDTVVIPPYSDLETLLGYRYFLRTILSGALCPDIDTINGKTHYFIPYPPITDIMEISNNLTNISLIPNPFSGMATVTFNSEVEGVFTVKMTNLLGAVVSTKEIAVSRGSNETSIERNGLSSGIYILSIFSGNGSINKKIVIE